MGTANLPEKQWKRGVWAFIAPAFTLIGLIAVSPIIFTFLISLYNLQIAQPALSPFRGLENYVFLLSDDRFINSLQVMTILIVIPVAIQVVAGFCLAVVMMEKLTGTGWMRLVFLLPAVIPPAVSGLLWKLFVVPEAGGLTYLASLFGTGLTIDFLNMPAPALIIVIVTSVWVGTPFVALLFLSALESLSKDQYEAARVDGANWVQTHRYVSLPGVTPVIRVVVVFRVLEALAIFPIIFVLTGGGPAGATEPINYYAYVTGFDYLQVDYAAAIISVFFVIMMVLCAPFLIGIARASAQRWA